MGGIECDLLVQGAAERLDDIAFDLVFEPVGIDDQPAIMGATTTRPTLIAPLSRSTVRSRIVATRTEVDPGFRTIG